jgi:hypothetical protein
LKRVLLYDVDSTIPNLPLMKISAYHKKMGDVVGFHTTEPDIIYASVIYPKNRHKINGLKFFYPNARIHIGGSGHSLGRTLPEKIEFIKPDYDLYPSEYSQGFTTRGCIRNCHFCIVPKKEGGLKRWQHPKAFHDERFDTLMIMDNNWLADKKWFLETSGWIVERGLDVKEHGLDIRLVDSEIARRLKELGIEHHHFAWDILEIEPIVRKKIKLLKKHGFELRSKVQFYVYVDSDSDADYDSAVYRCRKLKKWGTSPYIMFNIAKKRTERIKKLQRWANRKWLFWSIDIEDYNLRKTHTS